MNRKKLERLKNKAYRSAFVNSHIDQGLAFQIKALRDQRNWTQDDLASKLNLKSQSSVARFEDPSYGKLSISKLKQLSEVFDVGLLIKFVPFSRLLNEVEDLTPAALSAQSFEVELPILEEECEPSGKYHLWHLQNHIEPLRISIPFKEESEQDYLIFEKDNFSNVLSGSEGTQYVANS